MFNNKTKPIWTGINTTAKIPGNRTHYLSAAAPCFTAWPKCTQNIWKWGKRANLSVEFKTYHRHVIWLLSERFSVMLTNTFTHADKRLRVFFSMAMLLWSLLTWFDNTSSNIVPQFKQHRDASYLLVFYKN